MSTVLKKFYTAVAMSVINVERLIKDYGYGRGVFDVSIHVEKGEVFGFLGSNGSGNSTTIRNLMGFSQPDDGKVEIFGVLASSNAIACG